MKLIIAILIALSLTVLGLNVLSSNNDQQCDIDVLASNAYTNSTAKSEDGPLEIAVLLMPCDSNNALLDSNGHVDSKDIASLRQQYHFELTIEDNEDQVSFTFNPTLGNDSSTADIAMHKSKTIHFRDAETGDHYGLFFSTRKETETMLKKHEPFDAFSFVKDTKIGKALAISVFAPADTDGLLARLAAISYRDQYSVNVSKKTRFDP